MSNLQKIQSELNAPKDQYNSFAKFSYRSAESILESLKPILAQYEYSLVISDDMISLGERYYVKATVELFDESMKIVATASAFAREELSLKGQQSSQITGGTSSYARKYALNGLFLIDDNKDADTQDNSNHQQSESKVNERDLKTINELMKVKNVDLTQILTHYKLQSISDLPHKSAANFIDYLTKL